jgi:uncharacterized protein (TIGR03084 family)
VTDPRTLPILADLALEGEALDLMVADLSPEGWRTATPAEGWTVAHQVAHLTWTDEVAAIAATDKQAWDELVLQALGDPDGFVDAEAERLARLRSEELLPRWREARQRLAQVLSDYPSGEKMPWFGPPMAAPSMATARYMETWAHGLDVAEALGVLVTPYDRVRHVVHLGVRTRGFAFVNRGLPAPEAEVHVRLTAPSGEVWEYGDPSAEQRVTGSAWDFALLVTQRRHRADLDLEATGEDADAWLDIAQAFAGPAGEGRPPEGAS